MPFPPDVSPSPLPASSPCLHHTAISFDGTPWPTESESEVVDVNKMNTKEKFDRMCQSMDDTIFGEDKRCW